ncbi:MAG: shikimate dehydrogenase [Bacteroidales bacterium]|jgi:shikimate dehydrogenase|nr:shikimate dehydrogenase [Bacteroidales bacterium]
MEIYGLMGKKLEHSFSPKFFQQKFKHEKIKDATYQLYPLQSIQEFNALIQNNPKLSGLNVTIPYKTDIIPYLDKITSAAKEIGAVNTIKFESSFKNLQLVGYNTDYLGFIESLKPLLKPYHAKALVLGTGGSSKAVQYALNQLKINYLMVSRNPDKQNQIDYSMLTKDLMAEYKIIINTTPVGMFPYTGQKPDIPYFFLTRKHLLYDLIYNPGKTLFLQEGEKKGCLIKNGLEMLKIQAEYSWKIWNNINF